MGVYSQVWSSWGESQHLQFWGYSSEKSGLLSSGLSLLSFFIQSNSWKYITIQTERVSNSLKHIWTQLCWWIWPSHHSSYILLQIIILSLPRGNGIPLQASSFNEFCICTICSLFGSKPGLISHLSPLFVHLGTLHPFHLQFLFTFISLWFYSTMQERSFSKRHSWVLVFFAAVEPDSTAVSVQSDEPGSNLEIAHSATSAGTVELHVKWSQNLIMMLPWHFTLEEYWAHL